MINLLPDIDKKAIEHEYKLRRRAVILTAGIMLSVATIIFMTPSYVLSLYKGKSTNTEVAKAAAIDQAEELKSKAEITTSKALIKVLQPQVQGILPTTVISYLVKNKTAQNTITDFAYTRSADTGTISIIVHGVAKTRQNLSKFLEAMRHEQGITSADVPVSDFAKDTNIAYTMTITSTVK